MPVYRLSFTLAIAYIIVRYVDYGKCEHTFDTNFFREKVPYGRYRALYGPDRSIWILDGCGKTVSLGCGILQTNVRVKKVKKKCGKDLTFMERGAYRVNTIIVAPLSIYMSRL